MSRYIYEAWCDPEDNSITFATTDSIEVQKNKKILSGNSVLLYKIEAETYEEARAIHNLRQGWEPYKPMGEAHLCPECEAYFYPEDSGECWKCGYRN